MRDVVLSTGQTATIRTKDELTEGQSRKIEIARSRGNAVFQKFGVKEGDEALRIPPERLAELSDEDWANISGFEDALIVELTVKFDGGEDLVCPANLLKADYDALNDVVSKEYAGVAQSEGVDEKINPLAEAAESTPSSLETQT